MHNHQKGCNCNEYHRCEGENTHTDTKETDRSIGSFVFGLLSTCLFWVPITGLLLGIIGICFRKNKQHTTRDITLNVIGITLGSIVTMIYFTILANTP